jgi:allophanate hydrolase subunit 1
MQVPGLVETSPGVRSVMVEYEPRELGLAKLLEVWSCQCRSVL